MVNKNDPRMPGQAQPNQVIKESMQPAIQQAAPPKVQPGTTPVPPPPAKK